MKFDLIDEVVEQTDDRIVAIKQVTLAEEYLGDHFPDFPILPGVLMLETMVQAARRLLGRADDGPLLLGRVRALKYGAMVRPGEALEVEVTVGEPGPDGAIPCRGTGRVRRDGERCETAVSGRFTMRPVRLA
jgi:3-hydroxyacyl-[acyl-carrier-protein] dehydratase